MIEGPHIFGFSPVAFCINLTSTLASARLVLSVSASINAPTLSLVGLVLFSAIPLAFPLFRRLTQCKESRNSVCCTARTHRGDALQAHQFRAGFGSSITDAYPHHNPSVSAGGFGKPDTNLLPASQDRGHHAGLRRPCIDATTH